MGERSESHREREEDSSDCAGEDDPAEGGKRTAGAVGEQRGAEDGERQGRREPDDARAQLASFQTSPSARRKRGRASRGRAEPRAPTRIRNSGFQPGASVIARTSRPGSRLLVTIAQ